MQTRSFSTTEGCWQDQADMEPNPRQAVMYARDTIKLALADDFMLLMSKMRSIT